MTKKELLYLMNNLNRHGLLFLPGIGTLTADRILAGRPFMSLKELEDISGLTEKPIRKLLKIEANLYMKFCTND